MKKKSLEENYTRCSS